MQDAPASIPQWMQPALIALASILSGIGIDRLYNSWLNRKKPSAEIHVTEATANEIVVRTSSSAGDAVMRMIDKLSEAQTTIDRLRQERDAWQDEYDKVFVQRDEVLRQNQDLRGEIDSYEVQLKRMSNTLEERGLNYDGTQDADREDYTLPDKF